MVPLFPLSTKRHHVGAIFCSIVLAHSSIHLSFLISFTSCFVGVASYHVGDFVNTEVAINGLKRSISLRHLLPRFGLQWENSGRFQKTLLLGQKSYDDEQKLDFSYHFEDGLWSLPTISLVKKTFGHQPKFLDSVVIQFVIIKSSIGRIQAVTVKDVIYSGHYRPYFDVKYEWIEENEISPTLGHTIMFFAAFLFSIFVLLVSCGVVTTDERNSGTYFPEKYSYQVPFSAPKGD